MWDPVGWTAEFLEWSALWLIAKDDKVGDDVILAQNLSLPLQACHLKAWHSWVSEFPEVLVPYSIIVMPSEVCNLRPI